MVDNPKQFLEDLIDQEAYKRAKEQNQKLVDICFELVSSLSYNPIWISTVSHEDTMVWVAKQLRECGFDTRPVGLSWGVLKDK